MNEGVWTCIGALLGATIGGFTTYVITIKTIKLELKKINIIFLIDKLKKLESIKNNYTVNSYQTIDSKNEKDIINNFEILSKIYNDLSHYLINSIYFEEVAKEYEKILLESGSEIEDANSSLRGTYLYRDFNLKMDNLIKNELKHTITEIKQITI